MKALVTTICKRLKQFAYYYCYRGFRKVIKSRGLFKGLGEGVLGSCVAQEGEYSGVYTRDLTGVRTNDFKVSKKF